MLDRLVLVILCFIALCAPSKAQSNGLDHRCLEQRISNRALCAASIGAAPEASPAPSLEDAPMPATGIAPVPSADSAPLPVAVPPIPAAAAPTVGTLDGPRPPIDAAPMPSDDSAPLPPFAAAPMPQAEPRLQPPVDAAPLPPRPSASNPVGEQLVPALSDYAASLDELAATGSDSARRRMTVAGARIVAICTTAGYRSIGDCLEANGLILPEPP